VSSVDARERVVPRGVKETSAQARARTALPQRAPVLRPGEIVAFRGLFADVLCEGEVLRCAVRGRLETVDSADSSLMVVGDRVEVSDTGEGRGVVERMLERTNELVRAAPGTRHDDGGRSRHPRFRQVIAANVGRVMLVTSIREPAFRPGIVDRFLVAASSQGLKASLVMNKADLAAEGAAREELDGFRAIYSKIGLRVIVTSAVKGTGLAELAGALGEARTVLVGHSGVGKSSLLNALEPGLAIPARKVNRKTGKGTHATTVARLLRLASGAEVVDTPGVRELAIVGAASVDLEAHFAEFLPLIDGCEMDNCAHRAEPGCAVKQAVDDGRINPRRYESYLAIREEMEKAERPYAT